MTILNVVDYYNISFKWKHIQGKLTAIVKTPCLYHFWFRRSSPDKFSTNIRNCRYVGHIEFSMNAKNQNDPKSVCTTRGPCVPNFMQTQLFCKIANYDVMAAILDILRNKSSVKLLGTPICTYILSFVKIILILRKLVWNNTWRTTAILHVWPCNHPKFDDTFDPTMIL